MRKIPFLILLVAAPVLAGEASLLSIQKADGWGAVKAAVDQQAAAAGKPKKAAKALAAAGLGALEMPAAASLGAELVLKDPSPLRGCTWEGTVACTLDAAHTGDAKAEDYRLVCKTGFGGSAPMDSVAAAPVGERLSWRVTGVEKCWDLGGVAVSLVPQALADLEGVGKGDDLVPPELVELSQDEVEAIIAKSQPAFQHCTRKFSDDGSSAKGAMKVRYTIGDDGLVSSAKSEMTTFSDARVEQCVLEQFQKIKFRPPMGGYTGGVYSFTML